MMMDERENADGTGNVERRASGLKTNVDTTNNTRSRKQKATETIISSNMFSRLQKGKMKRGLLKDVLDLPMDILYEVGSSCIACL